LTTVWHVFDCFHSSSFVLKPTHAIVSNFVVFIELAISKIAFIIALVAPPLTLSWIDLNWGIDAPISRLQSPTIFILLLFVFVLEVTNAILLSV
jgi:hypothetical protein